MYEFDSTVRYSEVDSKGQMTWLALMDYFQDCSVFHSESVKLGVEYLGRKHLAWVLSSWQLCVERMPGLAEKIKVQTWPYAMKCFYGYRNFVLRDERDEMLAYANSIWVLVDTKTGRPVKVPQEMTDIYGMEPKLPMECSARKIEIPKDGVKRDPFVVPAYFIDTNQHMNNSRYVQVALTYLPERFPAHEVRVEYRRAALQNDVLTPEVSIEDDRVTVVLCGNDGKPDAVVLFLNKESGLPPEPMYIGGDKA